MIQTIFTIVGIFMTVCFSYQVIYLLVGLFCKPRLSDKVIDHRFAVLISARNEENVIENLLNSINGQTYPSELVDIYVVADNCTDNTAEISRRCGAIVYERFNKQQIGKGYALDFLLSHIKDTKGEDYYDGYFVFDADNLLEPDFIEQMNKTFSSGYKIITSYRNSKNYGSNWISAGYALWFLREARYLNNARMILGTSCAVSGTGFLFHRDILKKHGGWKFFLLTEDIQFSISNISDGETIGYCHNAMLYDEQPETFRQSWTQRLRWAKGFLQVFRHYGAKLFLGIFKNKNHLACFDLSITIMPIIFVTMLAIGTFVVGMIKAIITADPLIWSYVMIAAEAVLGAYMTFFVMGLVTVITEWKSINCTAPRKIGSLFTFPLYMFTWIPIGVVALFKKVEWKPIKHNVAKNLSDMKKK